MALQRVQAADRSAPFECGRTLLGADASTESIPALTKLLLHLRTDETIPVFVPLPRQEEQRAITAPHRRIEPWPAPEEKLYSRPAAPAAYEPSPHSDPNVTELLRVHIGAMGKRWVELSQKKNAAKRARPTSPKQRESFASLVEAHRWFQIAMQEDLTAANALLQARASYSNVGYLSQQVAEKALKGLLIGVEVVSRQEAREFGHDLPTLLNHIDRKVAPPATLRWIDLADAVKTLQPLATRWRYPGRSTKPPTRQEAENAVLFAKSIFSLCLFALNQHH